MAKTLVVYYSQSRGNTKKIAREIASTLGAKVIAQTDVQFDSAGGFYFVVDIWLRVCYNRDKIKERKCNDALY